MRATRNVVIAFVLLFIGLFFTSAHMFINAGSTPAMNLSANLALSEGTEGVAPTAVANEKPSRDSFVAMMKQELSRRIDKIVVPGPAKTAEVNENDDGENSATNTEEKRREIKWCDATILEAQFAAAWPSGVEVVEREGARLVVTNAEPIVSASGTVPSLPTTLMQFPVRPAPRSEPACLTNGYVGVTEDGRLIHNNDVILYQAYGPDVMIGYPFDGNPIYGAVADSAKLDGCGGVATPTGYQYHVRPQESFILGCFVSEPQHVLFGG